MERRRTKSKTALFENQTSKGAPPKSVLKLVSRPPADELEALALEGFSSGEPMEVGPTYWQEKHRQLDERLRKSGECGQVSEVNATDRASGAIKVQDPPFQETNPKR